MCCGGVGVGNGMGRREGGWELWVGPCVLGGILVCGVGFVDLAVCDVVVCWGLDLLCSFLPPPSSPNSSPQVVDGIDSTRVNRYWCRAARSMHAELVFFFFFSFLFSLGPLALLFFLCWGWDHVMAWLVRWTDFRSGNIWGAGFWGSGAVAVVVVTWA